jgi:hypothetical protein
MVVQDIDIACKCLTEKRAMMIALAAVSGTQIASAICATPA